MVRRNPYKKLQQNQKKRREKEEEAHAFSGMESKESKERKRTEKPMLTRRGCFFPPPFPPIVNLRAGTYADDDKKRIQQAHAAAGRPKTVVAGGGK